MQEPNSQSPQTVSMWITSLAISVTCCAILFVIFAGYLTEIKKSIGAGNQQIVQMVLDQQKLLEEIKTLQRTIAATQPVTVPSASTAPAAVVPSTPSATITPPSLTPASSSVATPPPVSPPAASTTNIPEVPAK